jgi:hypothetical protein
MASLLALLAAQEELQAEAYGYDFSPHNSETGKGMLDLSRIEYIRWNMLALQNELHEALDETGWKPWASSKHINTEEYLGELVDAFHFFMNLLLATGIRPEVMAEEFSRRYFAKREVNAKRQRDGYDGVSAKCPQCRRDIAEAATTEAYNAAENVYVTICVCGQILSQRAA